MPRNDTSRDEGSLIGEARQGSTAAFEELVRLYDAGVLRLALRLVRSEDEARDIYQETFLRAYRSIREFRGESGFRTWLYRIVTNLCMDRTRRVGGRRVESLTGPAAGSGREEMSAAIRTLADGRPESDPERVVAAEDIRRRLDQALRRLPERERLVFELRHDQDLRLSTVAEILETTEETVRNCLYRARQRLRADLSDLRGVTRGTSPGRATAAPARVVRAGTVPEPVNGVK